MTPVAYDDIATRHPQAVGYVLGKLGQGRQPVNPADVAWFLMECHDEPDEPLDEAAAADIMLTGTLPCCRGIAGRLGRRFACFGEMGCVKAMR